MIRYCYDSDFESMYHIINEAAEAYRGVIPADRWQEPYMPREELRQEIAHGVAFHGYERDGQLLGVMGLQDVQDVSLIRHAYVLPAYQGQGIGGKLLDTLRAGAKLPLLVGTWAAATWAIGFYERHGFAPVSPEEKERLLRRYWRVPERQIETSVVLAEASQ